MHASYFWLICNWHNIHIYPLGLYIGWWLTIIAGSTDTRRFWKVRNQTPSDEIGKRPSTAWRNQKTVNHRPKIVGFIRSVKLDFIKWAIVVAALRICFPAVAAAKKEKSTKKTKKIRSFFFFFLINIRLWKWNCVVPFLALLERHRSILKRKPTNQFLERSEKRLNSHY